MRGIALALCLVLGSLVGSTAASGGGSCATRNEYLRLHEGMWRHRVNLIFGFIGDIPAEHHDGFATRRFVGCITGTAAYVEFRFGRIIDKTWVRHE